MKLAIDTKQYLGEEIVCKSMRVVEDNVAATTRMLFSTRPIDFMDFLIDPPGPAVFMSANEDSGIIEVHGKDGHSKTMIYARRFIIQDEDMDTKSIIGINEHGGFVSVHGEEEVGAVLRITEDGGKVQVNDNDGNPRIGLGIVPDFGGGYINVFGNTKEDGVILGTTENGRGGFVNVYRGDSKKHAWLYINDRGEGDVYTFEDSQ